MSVKTQVKDIFGCTGKAAFGKFAPGTSVTGTGLYASRHGWENALIGTHISGEIIKRQTAQMRLDSLCELEWKPDTGHDAPEPVGFVSKAANCLMVGNEGEFSKSLSPKYLGHMAGAAEEHYEKKKCPIGSHLTVVFGLKVKTMDIDVNEVSGSILFTPNLIFLSGLKSDELFRGANRKKNADPAEALTPLEFRQLAAYPEIAPIKRDGAEKGIVKVEDVRFIVDCHVNPKLTDQQNASYFVAAVMDSHQLLLFKDDRKKL